MGSFVGLLFGTGLLVAWSSTWAPSPPRPHLLRDRWTDLAAQAGIHGLRLGTFASSCAGIGVVVAAVAFAMGSAISVAVMFGSIAAGLPALYVQSRARRRRIERRSLWPDVVDDLTSAVRAGLTLPESLIAQSERGPVELREDLRVFAAEYRATGNFLVALQVWQTRVADPVADRIAATLRIAAEVGGSDLGRILRTLSDFLRDDLRTRSELEARQSWTVNGARLAVAAPWIVLALMGGRPETAAAFDSPAGVMVLVVGAVVSALAYAAMVHIGRLPDDPRVLR